MRPERKEDVRPPQEEGFRAKSIGLIVYLFATMYLAISTGGPESMNLILPTLEKTFGWAPPEIAVKLGVVRMIGMITMFIAGTLMMRTGVKKILVPCTIIGGVLIMVMGNIKTMDQFIWVNIALGVFGPATMVAFGALTANWYVRTRGRVLGIITICFPLSTATFTLIGTKGIEAWGYQGFYTAFGAVTTLVAISGIWLVYDKPEDVGLSPDGIPFTEAEKAEIAEKESFQSAWSPLRIIKTPEIWAYTIAWAFIGLVLGSVMSQMIPVFTSTGISINKALGMMSVAALAGMPLSYVWGWFDDKIGTPKTTVLFTLTVCLAAVGMAFGSAENTIPFILAIVCIALGTAGMPNLQPSLLAYIVGRKEFINISRYFNIINGVFVSISMAYVPVMYAQFGSYRPVFLSTLIFGVIAIIALKFTQKTYDPERQEFIEEGKAQ
jgi:OFA family oxalate/formate antiporter-like MFS transporter